MATLALPRDDRIGLALAIALHAAVLAALVVSRAPPPVAKPEPVTVTISDDAAPTSTAPRPAPPAAEMAPDLGEQAPPQSRPQELARPAPPIVPPAAPAPPPPQRTATVAQARPRTPPSAPRAPARAAAAAHSAGKAPDAATPRRAGASHVGADFLKGLAGAPASAARGTPAAAIGPAQRASLSAAITRQLKPNWTAPQGADADLLVTTLAWDLDAGGRLVGKPRVVGQQGITDANRAQAARHAEQAIRAVELAAPFDLPAQYYAAWRHVAAFRFDRRLSQ